MSKSISVKYRKWRFPMHDENAHLRHIQHKNITFSVCVEVFFLIPKIVFSFPEGRLWNEMK